MLSAAWVFFYSLDQLSKEDSPSDNVTTLYHPGLYFHFQDTEHGI